jgi:predicted enzyme related to lactoylglutathione lyase
MLQKSQGEARANLRGGLTLYFICEDAKAAHREFKERGVQVGEPFVGNNMDVFYFKDPDGYRLSFESPIEK